MSSLITDTIREILMEDHQVCLPGIGTLRLTPQAAVASPIEGKVSPPSDRAIFNSNLILDDGRILQSLEEVPVLTETEAKQLLDEFLKNIRDNLDAGRSVTLDGIGRLFKHFDGEIKFTAGGENFSKDSFGLPDVQLKPIVRTEKTRVAALEAKAAPGAVDPLAPPVAGTAAYAGGSGAAGRSGGTKKQSKLAAVLNHPDLRQILWYVVAFLATIAIILTGYFLLQKVIQFYADEPVARVDTPALQVETPPARTPKPPVDADRIIPDEPPRLNEARDKSKTKEPAPFEQPAGSTVAAVTSPTDRTGVADETTNAPAKTTLPPATASTYNTAYIAIGLYGSDANVTKNKQRINKAGYEAFSRADGRYTRVGVRVQYTNRADLLETLRAVQKLYDDAYVMEINGESVKIQ